MLLLALIVKAKYLVDYEAREPLADAPYGDSLVYLDEVKRHFTSASAPEAFFKPPLYTAFLWLCDADSEGGRRLVRELQLLMGLATTWLVFALAKARGGTFAGVAAGLLLLAYGAVTYHETKLLDTTPSLFLTTLGVFLLDRGLSRENDASGAGSAFVTGIVFGIAAITRGANLVLAFASAPLWLFCSRPGRSNLPFVASHLFGAVLAIAPVTLHNFRASGDFIPVNYNEGDTFLIGNNENAIGIYAPPNGFPEGVMNERQVEFDLAKAALGHAPSAGEQRNHSFREGLRFLRENPSRILPLELDKLRFAVSRHEIGDNDSLVRERERFSLLGFQDLPFPALLALGLAGLALRRAAPRGPLLVPIALTIVSLVVFYVNERYRVAASPFLAVAASACLPFTREAATLRESPRGVALACVLFVLPGAYSLARPLPVRQDDLTNSESYFDAILDAHAAATFAANGAAERAAILLADAMARHPDVVDLSPRLFATLELVPTDRRAATVAACRARFASAPAAAAIFDRFPR